MSKKQILIVDDEEPVLYVLKNSLRKLGSEYEVTTATDAQSALALLRQQPFNLVITDYRMSGMDGLQLMEAIQDLRPETRVILITAFGNDALEAEARRLQAYRYLTKPLDISTFRSIVKEAFVGEVAVSRPGILILSDKRYRQIMSSLQELQVEVGARCIILTDANGQIIARAGDTANLHLEEIASLLCGGMATLQAAGHALDGDESAINLSYREGVRDILYSVNIGQELLLVIIVENGPYSSRLGSVWYHARQTAVNLRQMLGEANYDTAPQIFDDNVNEAFDSELDKLFGEDEDDLFGENADLAGSAMNSPTLVKETAVAPQTNTKPIKNNPQNTKTISLAEAAAQGLLPQNLIERFKK
jgi:CheY-like chemotaxis protein